MFCYNCLDCRWKTGLLRGEHWTSWREGSKPEGGGGGGGGGGAVVGGRGSEFMLGLSCDV